MREKIKRVYWKAVTTKLDGITIIEIILILVVIIGLVLIFRDQIEAIIQTAFNAINSDSEGIGKAITIE